MCLFDRPCRLSQYTNIETGKHIILDIYHPHQLWWTTTLKKYYLTVFIQSNKYIYIFTYNDIQQDVSILLRVNQEQNSALLLWL